MTERRDRRWPFYAAFITSGGAVALFMWIITQAFDWWHWRGQINGNLVNINRALEDSLFKQDLILQELNQIELELRLDDDDDNDYGYHIPQKP